MNHSRTAAIRGIAPLAAALALLLAMAMPVGAGKLICSLQATVGGGSATEVEVGEEVLIEGFGFPPGEVTLSYSVDGTPVRDETVTADASGSFETTVIPQAGEEGLWTVTATDVEELCAAETGFLVVAGPATPSPSPSPSQSPTSSPGPSAGELPDVAAPAPRGISAGWGLAAMFLLAATLVALRPRLARRVR
jgi:hypothetical protein